MIRRPPSSPLFPSTPLSRSLFLGREAHRGGARRGRRHDRTGGGHRTRVAVIPSAPVPPGLARADDGGRGRGDRKSTRLNSSHGYISYAVFCLKKKKPPDVSHPRSTDE